jgi:MAF protein
MPSLILASSSIYRRQLLAKLGLAFDYISPNIDESPNSKESPQALVERLAQKKALAIAKDHPKHLIIGSDQVACLEQVILTKPGNFENAYRQLKHCSGKTVTFYTGLSLINSVNGNKQTATETFTVTFRQLSDTDIKNYLHREQPYDCAGSFKVEGLGICLFEKLSGNDPNSLIGLPLIKLIDMLHNEGVNTLSE